MERTLQFPWGEVESLAIPELDGIRSVLLARMCVEPGKVSEKQCYPYCEEIVRVLEGGGELEMNGVPTCLVAENCIVIPAGCAYLIRSAGKSALVLARCYGSSNRLYEPC